MSAECRHPFFPVASCVVTGKRIVPLYSMQVIYGNCQNGYLVPGGIAGPPSPGGYKYGGLALQVGGWVTGLQPITITKLTVRKPELLPQKERSKNMAD